MREVLPSAYNTITSNRSIGYTMDSAIADIIDNSISAEATEIEIITPLNSDIITCLICDNGFGMDLDGLDNAMTFGGRDYMEHRERTDLGRYGLGLKTASLSQCKRFSVVTKKTNGRLIGGCWDLDLVKEHQRWQYLLLSEAECLNIVKQTPLLTYSSGTIVFWENFDRIEKSSAGKKFLEFSKQLAQTQDHLELVFHRYLAGETGLRKLSLKVNGHALEPNDPFLKQKNAAVVEPISITIGDEKITILPHKLMHPSRISQDNLRRLEVKGTLLNTQGFYVYRNQRLLIWGTWFGLAHKTDRTKLCRIQIDIPNSLDHLWSLDIKKSSAVPPAFLRDQLQKIITNVADISVRTFSKRIKTTKNKDPYWVRSEMTGKYCKYEINPQHSLISTLRELLDEPTQELFNNLIKELETYLPIAQLNYDLQRDYAIVNEINADSVTMEELEIRFDHLKNLGIPVQSILRMEPFCNNRQFLAKKEIET